MSLGNYGAARNMIQGMIASETAEEDRLAGLETFGDNQGVAMFADMVLEVAGRADLDSSKNLKARIFINGAADVDVSTTPALLLGVVAWSNLTQAANAVVEFFNTNTPTPGTTDSLAYVVVTGGGTLATASAAAVVYSEPVVFGTALSAQVVLNANAGIEAGTLSVANGTKVLVVYAN